MVSSLTDWGQSDYLSDLSPQLKKWDQHRQTSTAIEVCYRMPGVEWFERYAERIRECSNVLDCGWMPDEDGVLSLKFSRTNFCRVRWCAVCAWRRQLSWQSRIFEALPKIQERYPKYRWIFLTLTVRNCEHDQLRDTLSHMNKSFVRLTQRKAWPGVGWIKSVEVTHGDDGRSHPHFHALLLVKSSYFQGPNYLSQARFAELWKKCLRADYTPIVDVRACKGDIQKAVVETLKYSVKPSETIQDAAWLLEITKQLFKTRAVSVGGVLREFLRTDEPEPEDENDPYVPISEQYQYDRARGRYRRKLDA